MILPRLSGVCGVARTGPIHCNGCSGNNGVINISHGAADASGLWLRRDKLLPQARDRNDTKHKSTEKVIGAHKNDLCSSDAVALKEGSASAILNKEKFQRVEGLRFLRGEDVMPSVLGCARWRACSLGWMTTAQTNDKKVSMNDPL